MKQIRRNAAIVTAMLALMVPVSLFAQENEKTDKAEKEKKLKSTTSRKQNSALGRCEAPPLFASSSFVRPRLLGITFFTVFFRHAARRAARFLTTFSLVLFPSVQPRFSRWKSLLFPRHFFGWERLRSLSEVDFRRDRSVC